MLRSRPVTQSEFGDVRSIVFLNRKGRLLHHASGGLPYELTPVRKEMGALSFMGSDLAEYLGAGGGVDGAPVDCDLDRRDVDGIIGCEIEGSLGELIGFAHTTEWA